jgi:hypothetical protein
MTETDLIGDQCYINVKKKNGRPVKLNDELIEKICDLIRAGNYIEIACRASGLGKNTYYEYFKKSHDPTISDPIYKKFRDSVLKAEAESLVEMNSKMEGFEKGSWKPLAFRLERRFGNFYGKQQRIEVNNNPLDALTSIIEQSKAALKKKNEDPKPEDDK